MGLRERCHVIWPYIARLVERRRIKLFNIGSLGKDWLSFLPDSGFGEPWLVCCQGLFFRVELFHLQTQVNHENFNDIRSMNLFVI